MWSSTKTMIKIDRWTEAVRHRRHTQHFNISKGQHEIEFQIRSVFFTFVIRFRFFKFWSEHTHFTVRHRISRPQTDEEKTVTQSKREENAIVRWWTVAGLPINARVWLGFIERTAVLWWPYSDVAYTYNMCARCLVLTGAAVLL